MNRAESNSPEIGDFAGRAIEACRRLMGMAPTTWDAPGGTHRRSLRASLETGSVIVTRRRHANRAALEVGVLRALAAYGAPVPRVIAAEDGWLIQEDLGEIRLSAALAGPGAAAWLEKAVESLTAIHEAGRRAGLANRVMRIGAAPHWLRKNLLDAPTKVGHLVGRPPPQLDMARLSTLLSVFVPSFIKWDARPGNAIARRDGGVAWFDWEHCGVRCALDDLVWLLADEYIALTPAMEAAIVERHADTIGGGAVENPQRYVHLFGTFHICIRLGLILAHKGDGPWWDPALCLERDKICVTQEAALRLCSRGAGWAIRSSETASLAPWFDRIGDALRTP
jgi:hypothetical protein